jgi:acyl-CoA thioester hydrolase
MAELRRLHEATVAEEEIDHLGHMNVRFYLEKAMRATRVLAAEHGIGEPACRPLGATLELRDVYTRHYREQLVGAPLAVLGGVLEVRRDGLRLYHELVNTERDERAATFVHEVRLRDRGTRAPLPLPEMVAKSAGHELVTWPEHGRPRSIDLGSPQSTPSLEEAQRRGLATRKVRVVGEEECDAEGFFVATRYQDLVWGGEPAAGRSGWGPPVHALEGGGRFGWATLESRGVVHELPRAGVRIQSFGAEVALAHKTSLRHQWVFDRDRGTLLVQSSIVNLAFDLDARRAIAIPPRLREALETELHLDLL